jgi:hypothetical protein
MAKMTGSVVFPADSDVAVVVKPRFALSASLE